VVGPAADIDCSAGLKSKCDWSGRASVPHYTLKLTNYDILVSLDGAKSYTVTKNNELCSSGSFGVVSIRR